MHIYSYQIHNVLNVYRKQLSQGTARSIAANNAKSQSARERVRISNDGRRQSLFDKISSEIVKRITSFGPDTEFNNGSADQLNQTSSGQTRKSTHSETHDAAKQDTPFTYTLIDEHNRKITQKLAISHFGLQTEDLDSIFGVEKDRDTNSESE